MTTPVQYFIFHFRCCCTFTVLVLCLCLALFGLISSKNRSNYLWASILRPVSQTQFISTAAHEWSKTLLLTMTPSWKCQIRLQVKQGSDKYGAFFQVTHFFSSYGETSVRFGLRKDPVELNSVVPEVIIPFISWIDISLSAIILQTSNIDSPQAHWFYMLP